MSSCCRPVASWPDMPGTAPCAGNFSAAACSRATTILRTSRKSTERHEPSMDRLDRAHGALPSIPLHRQIEQAPERPAAEPNRLSIVEPQVLQPREDAGQRHVGHHRTRGEGAGAIMWAGAEGDAFGGIAGHV